MIKKYFCNPFGSAVCDDARSFHLILKYYNNIIKENIIYYVIKV